MSPSNRYFAVAESSDIPLVTIWDLVKNEKKRTLTMPESEACDIVWMDFSAENKQLLTLGGAPDWNLCLWNWEKGKILASTKVHVPAGCALYNCSINPSDANVAIVVGDGVLAGFRLTESTLKPITGYGMSLQQSLPRDDGRSQDLRMTKYYRHCWLSDDSLLVATQDGKLMLFDNCGEYRTTIPTSLLDSQPSCVSEFSRGFLVGVGDCVLVFEKADDPKEVYKRVATLSVSVGDYKNLGSVVSMTVAPSEDFFAVQTSTGQLIQLPLTSADMLRSDENTGSFIVAPFHAGAVNGLSLCVRKPLAVSCGVDKSIRIWNLEERTLDLLHYFSEEPLCVSFHPSGYLIVAGFSDKIRVLSVQMRALQIIQEIPIKACRDIVFSPGGQYFAAASGTSVSVYNTYKGSAVFSPLKHHSNKITSLAWSNDDTTLVSVGIDGGVIQYNMRYDGRRESETVSKGSKFSSAVVYKDLTTQNCITIAAGSDRMLKEFSQNKPQGVIDCGGAMIGQLCLAHSNLALFAGVAEEGLPGSVHVHRFPVPGEFIACAAHAAPLVKMVCSEDDSVLVTAGTDGSIYIFDARERDMMLQQGGGGKEEIAHSQHRKEKDFIPYAEEVLVTSSYLDEQTTKAGELERKVEEKTTTREFELRRRETRHKEDLMQLEFTFGQDVEQERTKLELLREEKADLEMAMDDRLRQLEAEHADLISSREADFQQKMTEEVAKCAQLQRERQAEDNMFRKRMEDLRFKYVSQLESLKNEMLESERDSKTRMQQLDEQASFREKTHDEMRRQLESDANRELVELATDYKGKVTKERNERNRHFCAAGTHRKGYDDLKREFEKSLEHLRHHDEVLETLKREHKKAYADKVHLAKTIEDHNNAIGLKEQRMFELKKQNQELEKFKFVLDHKIRELRSQIDPKAAELTRMQRHVLLIDSLLEAFHRKKMQLCEKERELDDQRRQLENTVVQLRTLVNRHKSHIQEIRTDVYACAEVLLDPARLREAVRALEARHLRGVDPPPPTFASDVRKETIRHKTYLESAVKALRRKLLHDKAVHREDCQRVISGNGEMIYEIEYYRRRIDDLKDKQKEKENSKIDKKHRQILQDRRAKLAKATAEAAVVAASARGAVAEGTSSNAPNLGLMLI